MSRAMATWVWPKARRVSAKRSAISFNVVGSRLRRAMAASVFHVTWTAYPRRVSLDRPPQIVEYRRNAISNQHRNAQRYQCARRPCGRGGALRLRRARGLELALPRFSARYLSRLAVFIERAWARS